MLIRKRVGARHVAEQRAVLTGRGVEFQRQVVGGETAVAQAHQRRQRMLAHQRVQRGRVVLLEVGARTQASDTALVVRTAGLARGTSYTPAGLRAALEDAVRRVYGLGLFEQVGVDTARLDDDIFVSSYRQVVDLAGDDSSRFVIPMGQSGHVWSDRYANLLDTWNKVEYLPMRFTFSTSTSAPYWQQISWQKLHCRQ